MHTTSIPVTLNKNKAAPFLNATDLTSWIICSIRSIWSAFPSSCLTFSSSETRGDHKDNDVSLGSALQLRCTVRDYFRHVFRYRGRIQWATTQATSTRSRIHVFLKIHFTRQTPKLCSVLFDGRQRSLFFRWDLYTLQDAAIELRAKFVASVRLFWPIVSSIAGVPVQDGWGVFIKWANMPSMGKPSVEILCRLALFEKRKL